MANKTILYRCIRPEMRKSERVSKLIWFKI
jgi:hypothetical protein